MKRGRRAGFVLSLILIAALPSPALAKKDPPRPDGLPATDAKHPWRFLPGVPRVDTLAYTPREIIPVACQQFGRDKWQIYAVDAPRGRIVTRWKPIHHPLLFLFMGHVNAQCTVTIQPLGPARSRLVFQGDLASHRDLRGNAMLGAAKKAYATGARNYVKEVRAYLDAHRRRNPGR
jgi:hypothetical protein